MPDTPNHMWLWERVCKTDPADTKPFQRGGGFRGTAINSCSQIRKATEVFGPVGCGWGWDVEDERYVEGAPLTDKTAGNCREVIHMLRIRFWWLTIAGEPSSKMSFPVYGQTVFVGQNKNGYFTDEEAPKKSLTDAVTNALAKLGFNADIYLGKFDDNKYVNDRRNEVATAAAVAAAQDAAAEAPQTSPDDREPLPHLPPPAQLPPATAAQVKAFHALGAEVAKLKGITWDEYRPAFIAGALGLKDGAPVSVGLFNSKTISLALDGLSARKAKLLKEAGAKPAAPAAAMPDAKADDQAPF